MWRFLELLGFLGFLGALATAPIVAQADEAARTDSEVWNEGVGFYRDGDATNALRVLRPLMLSKSHGARAAEVVAALEHDRGNREEAAVAAQIALRAHPDDPKANRNFTRATDGLSARRETERINAVLKAAEGRDPGSMLGAATKDARAVMTESGTYRTNRAERAVALSDALAARARRLSDIWYPVREVIAQSVTNEEQAATILAQVEAAQAKTKKAAEELSDLNADAYSTLSDVEHDFTRFFKLTVLPPAAIEEGLVAQSNAWLDAEAFNGRPWQSDALDFTRAFRAKFPAWARAYEQQAQADTNKPPFTAEDQAKVSALATELEKFQLECLENEVPATQEKALGLLREIRELLPKDRNGGGGGQSGSQQNPQQNPDPNRDPQQDDKDPGQQEPPQETQGDQPENEPEPEAKSGEEAKPEERDDKEVEALLQKAKERNDEHEEEKRLRMRKSPLPPNERDW